MNLGIKKLGLKVLISILVTTSLMSCERLTNKTATAKSLVNEPLYLRGAFNGWSTDNALSTNQNRLRTKVSVGIGIHAFKVANNDWSKQWLLASEHVIDLEHDGQKSFPLEAKTVDYNSQILAPKPATFEVVVDMSVEPASLSIENIQFSNPSLTAPHDQDSLVELSFDNVTGDATTVGFSIKAESDGLRTYVHSTSQLLRDPVPQYSVYQEHPELPYIRTGNTAFDALFALSMDEMKLNSVGQIKDGNYNLGQAIDCNCFETGEKWNYVWTRDLAYAAQLGLSFLDPERTVNSLRFKTSGLRPGTQSGLEDVIPNGKQIVQDTGSGGSWPISTDRVSWAFGANSVLPNLTGTERAQFAQDAFRALSNTIEVDRVAVFNAEFGLYQGEQSFLDWREQSYAKWIVDDLASMATSMSLSTNVGHYQALKLASELARELQQVELANKYGEWAVQLKQAINDRLWLPERGLYASLTSGHPFPVALEKFDWLGLSLAIVTGIASEQQAKQILANYPHSDMGPPVIFPQQPDIQIYHNRAIWPFVTAFGLQAAKHGNNVEVAEHAIMSLMRGAAVNLSNMENLEWLSGQSIWLDRTSPSLSGPAINSKRQLWSVAGYINMAMESMFGINTDAENLVINPFIPVNVAQKFFQPQSKLHVKNVQWHGKQLNLTYHLPSGLQQELTPFVFAAGTTDARVLKVQKVTIDDRTLNLSPAAGATIPAKVLGSTNQVDVYLSITQGDVGMTKVAGQPSANNVNHFAPVEPKLTVTPLNEYQLLQFDSSSAESELLYDVYRNGQLVAENLSDNTWQDRSGARHAACYSVAAKFAVTNNVSHHSKTLCTATAAEITMSSGKGDADLVISNKLVTDSEFGPVIKNWGGKDDYLSFNWQQSKQQTVAVQLQYRNLNQSINTGVTAAVKQLVITHQASGKVLAKQVVQMPHTKNDAGIGISTPVIVTAPEGNLTISVFDYMNMSYLGSNQTYSSAGGTTGPLNTLDVYGVRLTPIQSKN